jgi:hypothetical protein
LLLQPILHLRPRHEDLPLLAVDQVSNLPLSHRKAKNYVQRQVFWLTLKAMSPSQIFRFSGLMTSPTRAYSYGDSSGFSPDSLLKTAPLTGTAYRLRREGSICFRSIYFFISGLIFG